MRRPVFSPAALVLVSCLASGLAFAQQTPSTSPQGPCAADVARLCPDAHGRAGVHACLKQNADQVSAECKARIEEVHQKFEAAKAACQPDVAKFCADVKPGGHRVAACLRDHASELSEACQAAIPAKKGG
jgi:cysteine rich repeat protein